jgi:hypothetical protein
MLTAKSLPKKLWILLLVSIFAGACASPAKLVESGNFDYAVELAVRKLAGKKNKNAKYVKALEDAFGKATARDMRAAEYLKNEGRPENWVRIREIYARIDARQRRVEPLLPLFDKHGYKADFRFVRVDGLEQEAKENAAEYLYANAQKLLGEARRGDKPAARAAYQELEKIGTYYRDYKDRRELMNQARDLGVSRILVAIENAAPVVLPRAFEQELERMSLRDLNKDWREYYLQPVHGITFDYKVVMKITQINVSPSLVKEREYEDAKEIEDGFEYVLDERGNVRKDSLGNDIKVPKKVFIRAQVLETYQHKAAAVAGHLEFIDLRTRGLIDSKPLAAEAVFENYASTFRGDKRALSEESKRRIGNRPLPFPSEESLLLDAANRLKPIIRQNIERANRLI